MRIRHTDQRKEKVRLQMSAMIDIVFLLLVFFVMTFTIVAVEGDLNVNTAGRGTRVDPAALALRVRLTAAPGGQLASIRLNDRKLDNFDDLRHRILQIAEDRSGLDEPLKDVSVEFDCDPNLDYENTINAVSAASGYLRDDGSKVTLIEKVRLVGSGRH